MLLDDGLCWQSSRLLVFQASDASSEKLFNTVLINKGKTPPFINLNGGFKINMHLIAIVWEEGEKENPCGLFCLHVLCFGALCNLDVFEMREGKFTLKEFTDSLFKLIGGVNFM